MRSSLLIACLAAVLVAACGGGNSPAEATWETQTVAPETDAEDASDADASDPEATDGLEGSGDEAEEEAP